MQLLLERHCLNSYFNMFYPISSRICQTPLQTETCPGCGLLEAKVEVQFAILMDLQRRLEALEGQLQNTPANIPQPATPPAELAFEYERDEEGNVNGDIIDEEVIQDCVRYTENSKSREYIAHHMVKKIFSKGDRLTKNCSGKGGKQALGIVRMNAAKREVFKLKSTSASDKESLRKNCTCSIDSMNRDLKRRKYLQST